MNITTPNVQYVPSTTTSTSATSGKTSSEAVTSVATGKAESAVSADESIDRGELDSAVASMQNYAQSIKRNLDFHLDDSSGRVVVQVVASDSGEVIRQIPSEEALELAANLDGMRSLLFREQA
ncbi:flagellar protein FlaG [Pseudomonas sp. PS02288]|uniref:flagellar protein FlaG n=1 Tax=Pseudomonas sp. PS02288 TaxID=2991443 RepID=UPI002499CC1A|nr:flagellar protein FlaG [Pseudomonas sp. PS02288]